MKLTTLVENLVYQPGLVSEHGLSFFLDTGRRRILFDTGQSNAFLTNAKDMNIDISKADALVISHGHYDHTGGLIAFLEENDSAPVYMKREALEKKYNNSKQFIGTIPIPDVYMDRVKFVHEVTGIDEGVFIVPSIPVVNEADTSFGYFYTGNENDYAEDEFQDELFLAVVNNNKVSVISSCSHRGISNITEACRRLFNLPVNLVTGGFHLKGAPKEHVEFVANYLQHIKPDKIGVCHCTGVENLTEMTKVLGDKIFYNHTGNTIQI